MKSPSSWNVESWAYFSRALALGAGCGFIGANIFIFLFCIYGALTDRVSDLRSTVSGALLTIIYGQMFGTLPAAVLGGLTGIAVAAAMYFCNRNGLEVSARVIGAAVCMVSVGAIWIALGLEADTISFLAIPSVIYVFCEWVMARRLEIWVLGQRPR
jgi:hypothetical protein